MTPEEASQRYEIPMELLKLYASWREGVQEYDDRELAQLGMMMTLRNAGFDLRAVKMYMQALADGGHGMAIRLQMLAQKRAETLEEIHCQEKRLNRLDYLRYCILCEQEKEDAQ